MSPPLVRSRAPHTGRLSSRGGGLVALGVFVALLLAWLPSPAASQTPIERAEAQYDTAFGAYEQVLQLRDRLLSEHEVLMDRLQDARDSGEEDRIQDAMYRVWERGVQLSGLDRQLQVAAAELREAAQRLLRLLDDREDALLDRLEQAAGPAERSSIEGDIAQLRSRHRQVEQQVGAELVPTIRPLPELTIRPTDGPRQLTVKATILEDRADEYEVVLEALDGTIADLQRRIQQERGREDLLAGISRFDDDQITGGGITGGLPEDDDGSEEDPGGLILAELPLPQQVAELQELRERVEDLRVEALARARVFRERAERGTR